MNEQGMPSLLMQAAQSAAQADGLAPPPDNQTSSGTDLNATNKAAMAAVAAQQAQLAAVQQQQQQQQQQRKLQQQQQQSSGGGSSKKKGSLPLRRGKWTPEEEAYANRLIQEFKAGLLPLTDGTTLRTFLSKLLNCDPMRISKKFVGSNCIGKQVFRRRTADLNRLTPDQIQKSRAELSELERRFLERVAQTNRVKSNGVGNNNNANAQAAQNNAAAQLNMHHAAMNAAAVNQMNNHNNNMDQNPFDFGNNAMNLMMNQSNNNNNGTPPWLQPPLGYKQGMGAQMAVANLAGGQANSRAAAAGRALLGGLNPGSRKSSSGSDNNNAGLLAMAELQRRASRQALLNAASGNSSAQNLLAALSGGGNSNNSLEQMARNASVARLGALANGNSFNNLMLKTGFSRDQLSKLAQERGLSSASLSNMMERKNSFDALMSLDFQSLQSIDNLANLIQTGGTGQGQAPTSGMKNDTFGNAQQSNASLSNAARRLASANNLEQLMRTLSQNNMNRSGEGNKGSNSDFAGLQSSGTNLQSLLQNVSSGNIASAGGGANASMSSLLGTNNGNSAASLANLLRDQSQTGLSALRMQDGLNQRNSSVEDFLSLVAAGDIPHQDPALLNLSLSQFQQQQQQQQQQNGGGDDKGSSSMLAQQQMLAQATGNSALANALASRSFGNLGGLSNSGSNLNSLGSTAELLQQMAGASSNSESFNNMKRKLLEVDGGLDSQGASKR